MIGILRARLTPLFKNTAKVQGRGGSRLHEFADEERAHSTS